MMTKNFGPDAVGLGIQERAVINEAREALEKDDLELFHKIAHANPDLKEELELCEREYFSA